MRQIAALAAMILMLSCPVWSLSFSGSGVLSFAGTGALTVKGTTEAPPAPISGWLTATMTSNTAPSPNVVTQSEAGTSGWHAFDRDLYSNVYLGMGMGGDWIKFDFGSGNTQICNKIYIKNMELFGVKDWTLHGSNNDSTWTSLGTGSLADDETLQGSVISNTTAYRYYRLTADTAIGEGMGIYIYELELWNE